MFICYEENTGRIVSWGTSHMTIEGFITVEVEDMEFEFNEEYFYRNGFVEKDMMATLESLKEVKKQELNEQCQLDIEKGFTYNNYFFSFDKEAQNNFITAQLTAMNNQQAVFLWTAKDETNEYVRIELTAVDIIEMASYIMQHKENRISKLRDILYPIIDDALTIEEINDIHW